MSDSTTCGELDNLSPRWPSTARSSCRGTVPSCRGRESLIAPSPSTTLGEIVGDKQLFDVGILPLG